MIGAEHEQAQSEPGPEFFDSVSIDFSDAEQQLFGLAWVTRLPNAGRSRANTVLFAGGELVEHLELESDRVIDDWREGRLDGVRMSTVVPLERWSFAASGSETSLEIEADALTPPRELSDRTLLETVGVDQYEQLCHVSGTVKVAGRTHALHCLGRRVHSWGNFAWGTIERWRALYAVSASGRAFSVAAALPTGSTGHGQELRAACLLDTEEAQPFEDVYLSTVYSASGLPAKAGLELSMPGDEMPRRFGGEAICAMRTKRSDHELIVSFFRWSIEGEPAYGCYEIARR